MRGTASSQHQTTTNQPGIERDHHLHGWVANVPLALLCLVVLCAVVLYIFTQLQITSTEQAVFGLLALSVQVKPGMTALQLSQLISGNADRYQTIADAIGWSVQIALLTISFPPDAALLSLHRKYNQVVSPSLSRAALAYAKCRRLVLLILIGGDVATDFWYVVQGHTLAVWNGSLLPDVSSSMVGVLIVGVVYPVAICFITVFVGKYLFVYLDALVERLRHATETV